VSCFKKAGHKVRLISLIGEQTNVQNSQTQKWEKIKKLIPPFIFEFIEIAYNLPGFLMLRKNIKAFKPDFIYDRYAHYSFAAILAGAFYKIPLILEVNSPYSIQKRLWEKLYFPRMSQAVERRIFKTAPRIITVSTPLKNIVRNYGVGENKIMVLPNGTDLKKFNPAVDGSEIRKKYDMENCTVLGFVGILRKWHNVETLIDVLTEIDLKRHNARMLFIGDGPIMGDLIEYAREKGQEGYIHFVGRVSHEKIAEYVAAVDITISPHATFYSSPMKILEYMAMGKAILAPDMLNIRDLITDQSDGLLFTPNDRESLKEKLTMLMEDRELRKKLGKNAIDLVWGKFTWENNAQRSIELAQKLIENHSAE